jgi:hypothetical protein
MSRCNSTVRYGAVGDSDEGTLPWGRTRPSETGSEDGSSNSSSNGFGNGTSNGLGGAVEGAAAVLWRL